MRLLRIDSSARAKSVSRQLTDSFVAAWKEQFPDGEIVSRDLTSRAVPAIGDEWVAAARTDPAQRTAGEFHALAFSDELIEELQAANIVLIGAPMHNFSISAALKAWIDQIVRPGRTVQYGPEGPRGLLAGKRVVVLTSRGGAYSNEAERSGLDYQEPYLRAILAFIGLTEVAFIHAENQLRPQQADLSRANAIQKIDEFVKLSKRSSVGKHNRTPTLNPNPSQGALSLMPTIEPIVPEAASPKSRQLLEMTERRLGWSTQMLRTMAHAPAILEAYLQFNRAFEETKMSSKLRGSLTMAIAQTLGCEYILSVALALGQREGLSLEELEAARRGESTDPKIALALRFALGVVEQHGKIDPPLVTALRDAGYSDEETVEIIEAIALNLFRNYFNLIARTEVDFPLVRTSEPLPQIAAPAVSATSGNGNPVTNDARSTQ